MSAFDEFVNGAKKAFDYASVKTNEVVEATKVQIEKSQLSCKLRDEYEKLGRTCYKMSETGEDLTGQMKLHISKIKELIESIKQATENSASKSKLKTCENCNFVVSPNYQFCPKCGAKL